MDTLEVRDWDQYVLDIETSNNVKLDDDFKVQIFKEGFLDWQQDVYYEDYRLSKDEETEIEWEQHKPILSEDTEKFPHSLWLKMKGKNLLKQQTVHLSASLAASNPITRN